MLEIVEVKHTAIQDGKTKAKNIVLSVDKNEVIIPRWRAVLLERWVAQQTGERKENKETSDLMKNILKNISERTLRADQRDVFYALRGSDYTGDAQFRGIPFASKKMYDLFTSEIMEKVQLLTLQTIQGMGIRSGPRGFLTGIGTLYVPAASSANKWVDLSSASAPILSFDLSNDDTDYQGNARKIIHFEKAAGFESLVAGDTASMIEAIFTTSQGYLVEAANRFLRHMQNKGLNLYVVHDGDPHGLQMTLSYGLSSKSSAYMPSDFYPIKNKVVSLGFYPRVANDLGLPAEDVKESHEVIFNNLKEIATQNPEIKADLDVILNEKKQWEFQSLSSLQERAGAIYLVETLRLKEDEIKYVPEAEVCKQEIIDPIKQDMDNFINHKIEAYVNTWFTKEDGLKSIIVSKLKELLANEITEWTSGAEVEYQKLLDIDQEVFREAIKKELVEDPKRYWNNAARSVVNQIYDREFKINAEPQVELKLEKAEVEKTVEVTDLETAEQPLTKNDIVASIEKRMVPRSDRRDKIVTKIRNALEKIFGEPDLTW